MTTMNERAAAIADRIEADATRFRAVVHRVAGARVIDCMAGGLEIGLLLARACLADSASVELVPGDAGISVVVRTDDPVRACLGSQYAGWQVKADGYFAMGSGPMRALSGREEILKQLKISESHIAAVGILETKTLPSPAAIETIVSKLPVEVERITLLFAPAASLPGTIQVVSRSVETALHKLHELKFDVTTINAGFGLAPLPPVAKDELAAIGRTNDAILYGGRVTLWLKAEQDAIDEIGPKVPSNASKDHGARFAELFARYGDFYKIDPMLFSPAEVTFVNLGTGIARTFGRLEPELLKASFAAV